MKLFNAVCCDGLNSSLVSVTRAPAPKVFFLGVSLDAFESLEVLTVEPAFAGDAEAAGAGASATICCVASTGLATALNGTTA